MNAPTLMLPAAPQRWRIFLLCFFIVAYIFTAIVPPFQAPDEFDHVERAYLLSEGHVMLESINGSPSGGQIDQGLLDYMSYFTPLKSSANRKISMSELASAGQVRWANDKFGFRTPTGTAYYFPALYLPAAIGLKIGRTFNLTISHSYHLARLLTLCACLLILLFAFRLYPPPTFVLAILALPMNLFLLSTTVLDSMATSVAILALAAFMRTVADKNETSLSVIRTLVISTSLVAACRANLLPLLALPFAAYIFRRERQVLAWATISTLLVLAWTVWTVKFTVYPPGGRDVDHMGLLLSYVFHPIKFLAIVYATLSDPAIVSFYGNSFIGVLGWLDTPLPEGVYHLFGIVLITLLILSFSWHNFRADWKWRGLVILCAIASILLIFLALLVQWTIGPAVKVDGVQGRYFTIPVLILAYALFSTPRPMAGIGEMARTYISAFVLILTINYGVAALVNRYHTAASQQEDTSFILKPSLPLSKDRPIEIHFSPDQVAHPKNLNFIAIRIGTYMTSHPGYATLRLWTVEGDLFNQRFDLSNLVDNAYRKFPLDGKPYVGGEIVSDGGEGISTYESRLGRDGAVIECLQLGLTSNSGSITPGCPLP